MKSFIAVISPFLIIMAAMLTPFSMKADEKGYEVVSCDKCETSKVSGEVVNISTLDDEYIAVEIRHRWKTEAESMLPQLSLNTVLQVGGREYELLNLVALKPGTYEPTDDKYLGMTYWNTIKAGDVTSAIAIFKGKLKKGEEKLAIIDKNDESSMNDVLVFKSIKIDNPLKEKPSTSWLGHTTAKTSLHSTPGKSGKTLKSLDKGTLVFVDTQDESNGYYKVIVLNNNQEGYVNKKLVSFDERMPKITSGAFKQINSGGANTDAQVTIKNSTQNDIKLLIGPHTFKFKPYETRTVSVPAGNYRIIGSSPSAPEIKPLITNETFMEGCGYEREVVVIHGKDANTKIKKPIKSHGKGKGRKRK